MKKRINLEWTLGWSDSSEKPADMYPCHVPGCAQQDIAEALGYPDFKVGGNYRQFAWMEDKWFHYKASFPKPELRHGESLWFVSEGIDYECTVIVNGVPVVPHHEGMFSRIEADLSGCLKKDNSLTVKIFPHPKRPGAAVGREEASASAKPPVGYGWDWHPRLLTSGIWADTCLEVRKRHSLDSFDIRYTLNDSMEVAFINVEWTGDFRSGDTLSLTLEDPSGKTVIKKEAPAFGDFGTIELYHPELWWTHDQGKPSLYKATLSLEGGDAISKTFGFRRIRLVMNEGSPGEGPQFHISEDGNPASLPSFPKTCDKVPAQFELNGRRIFAKGTSWVAPEIFPSAVTAQRCEELVRIAKDTNFNILRCWGGCIVNKDFFFDICDREGMLVWQEFPLSCNNYPDDPAYLKVLEQEATAIVLRLRHHPCIALWCGGNELQNNWSGMTVQSLPLRLLDSICLRYSPEIPFNMTSPLYGIGHGGYLFSYDGRDIFQVMNISHFTAYCEAGMPGASPMEVIRKIIPADELRNPGPGGAWEDHHAYKAWDGKDGTWLETGTIEKYLGKTAGVEDLIEKSQLLQSVGYREIYEEARRQKPYCSMVLNWCYDEPWPSAANNSLVVWPAVPKPALKEVREACRPICASARFDRFDHVPGENLDIGLWVLNDSPEPFRESLRIKARLLPGNPSDGEGVEAGEWTSGPLKPGTNAQGPVLSVRIPEGWTGRIFRVILDVPSHPGLSASYTMALRSDRTPEQ